MIKCAIHNDKDTNYVRDKSIFWKKDFENRLLKKEVITTSLLSLSQASDSN
jgi:hypothetical protein